MVNENGVATGVSSATINGVDVMNTDDTDHDALVPVEALNDGAVLAVMTG